MREITFNVEHDDDSSCLVASWDDPSGRGGITTQGQDLRELEAMIREAVRCHFDEAEMPHSIRLHFVTDPVLVTV